jgi:mRNA interferase RelE/StbE
MKFQATEPPPFHPSLRIRKMQGHPDIWEGHVTRDYVFTFHVDKDPESGEAIFVFRNIGTHEIYRSP